MNFPTLKHPRLCRFLPYILVTAAILLPLIAIINLPFLPDPVKALAVVALIAALLFCFFREIPALMVLDMGLAWLSCYRTARTQYQIPPGRTLSQMEMRIARYGIPCTPIALQPQPDAVRYRFSAPWTVYSRGIERVLVSYHTDYLDADTYRAIFSSGKANSNALTGTRKALFPDKHQKTAPLNRVTVIFIFARQVDPRLAGTLYELVCKQCGDEWDTAILPCVVDLSRHTCTFNSLRLPYTGFAYPVKNRGIRLIRRFILGGQFPLAENQLFLPAKDPVPMDMSLWAFWKTVRQNSISTGKDMTKTWKRMADRQILLQEGLLYLKWEGRGILLSVRKQEETKALILEPITSWTYPNIRPIAKKTVLAIREFLEDHFRQTGWSVSYELTKTAAD